MAAHLLDAAVWQRVAGVLTDPHVIAREIERRRHDDPTAAETASIERRLDELARRQRDLIQRLADVDDADVVGLLRAELTTMSAERAALADACAGQRPRCATPTWPSGAQPSRPALML